MANGERCKKCGYQESAHNLGEAVVAPGIFCEHFESEVEHLEDCPTIDCDGDCEVFIERIAARQKRDWDKIEH